MHSRLCEGSSCIFIRDTLTWEARALLPDAKRQSGDEMGELKYAFANDPKRGIKIGTKPRNCIYNKANKEQKEKALWPRKAASKSRGWLSGNL